MRQDNNEPTKKIKQITISKSQVYIVFIGPINMMVFQVRKTNVIVQSQIIRSMSIQLDFRAGR